jgi:hypothetical protein
MTTKGMSVTAARLLVDELCGRHEIPLLVLHDFDTSGFSILGSLRRDSDRYRFRHKIRVIDLGLRLQDVLEYGLQSEAAVVRDTHKLRRTLALNGAREEEIEFLVSGKRVELNAFTSKVLIAWIDSKLQTHGIRKVVPTEATLAECYREAIRRQYVAQAIAEATLEAEKAAAAASLPGELGKKVKAGVKSDPARPWDIVVAELAKRAKA